MAARAEPTVNPIKFCLHFECKNRYLTNVTICHSALFSWIRIWRRKRRQRRMDQDSEYIMKSASRMKIRSNTSPFNYTRSFLSLQQVFSAWFVMSYWVLKAARAEWLPAPTGNRSLAHSSKRNMYVVLLLISSPPFHLSLQAHQVRLLWLLGTSPQRKKAQNFTQHQWHRVFSGGINVMRQACLACEF